MEIEFWIDTISPWDIKGWAWLPDDPDTPLTIELVASDGAILHRARATEYRDDLAASAKRRGWCSFVLEIDPALASGIYTLIARNADETVELLPSIDHKYPTVGSETVASFDGDLRDASGAQGSLDVASPDNFSGWLHVPSSVDPAPTLILVADGAVVARGSVDVWRNDLEDLFQGNGRQGFSIAVPSVLRDGTEHRFDLLREGSAESLLSRPITIAMPMQADAEPDEDEPSPPRPPEGAAIELSVIVNFYNMPQEAERTLISLSRCYQRDIGDIAYEVLCIDNGSNPPMTEADVTRHGPEFRLVRPSNPHPSPVFALNEVAREARGRYVAMMIDGAHLLSPGVIVEAIGALRDEPRAIVALRHWFIAGDQRWLSAIGFRREQQELPLARIGWPGSGYDIFRISAPIHDSPNTWFDSMSESNCLFVSKADFTELGGYDEGFAVAGGGFANLDLFARAAALPDMAVVALVGEATFHQYHEGTTTNVSDAEKESRVRRYATDFETLRGDQFRPIDGTRCKFRGVMRSPSALNVRQSPSGKVRLGLTPEVRPVPLSRALDTGSRKYLDTAYVETGGPAMTIWLGQPTGVAPADLVALQRVLWERRPDVLLMTDVAPGLLHFIRSIMPGAALEGLRLIWLTGNGDGETPPGVNRVVGSLADHMVRAQVAEAIGPVEGVMALFQPTSDHPLDALRDQARYVTAGDYLVVLGTAFGQPTLGYSTRWTSNAVHRFLEMDRRFVVDRTMETHMVSTCPGGFLLRVPDSSPQAYDQSLDRFEDA